MRLGKGRGTLLKKGFPSPSPNPIPSSPKTFTLLGFHMAGTPPLGDGTIPPKKQKRITVPTNP